MSAPAVTDYAATIDRLLDMLKGDSALSERVAEFRYGHLPEDALGNSFPLVYVTTARTPESGRVPYGVTDSAGAPVMRVETEYWVTIISDPAATPADAQRSVDALRRDVVRVINGNIMLRPPADPVNGAPLSAYTTVATQARLTSIEGRVIAGTTVMVTVTTFEGGRASAGG